jgi:hypothetical protein
MLPSGVRDRQAAVDTRRSGTLDWRDDVDDLVD